MSQLTSPLSCFTFKRSEIQISAQKSAAILTGFSRYYRFFIKQNSQDNEKENGDVQRTMSRRGYISAGEKIQVELQEMQKREEELRYI